MKTKKAVVEKVTVTLPADMLEALDRAAAEDHRTRSGQVQFFLSRAVARRATPARAEQTQASA